MAGFSRVLVGLQYGDEGKARVLDRIVDDSDVVARFNGGPNAGHSLEVKGRKIALHQVPSGIFHPQMALYVGSGCVLNPVKLVSEIREIESLGVSLENRLHLSGNATLIQPHHVLADKIKGQAIGTTGNGIGPAYADLALRMEGERLKTLRFGDGLAGFSWGLDMAKENLKDLVREHKICGVEISREISRFGAALRRLEKYLCADPLFLEKQVQQGKIVLFEGAQSTQLDLVYGTYPYVTSSRTISAAAYTGGDLSLRHHKEILGVAKAIMSRVGNGPFVSEFGGKRSEQYCAEGKGLAHTKEKEQQEYDPKKLLASEDWFELGIALRMLGKEYGATTKRPRRVGMLDLVLLRQGCQMNAVDKLYINKFDELAIFRRTCLPGIPLVAAYRRDGKEIDYLPSAVVDLEKIQPVVEYLPHVPSLSSCRSRESLPGPAWEIIKFIEEKVGVPIYGIGVGPERNQFVEVKE